MVVPLCWLYGVLLLLAGGNGGWAQVPPPQKVANLTLENTHWRLTELNGKPVQTSSGRGVTLSLTDPFFGNNLNGGTGVSVYTGSYRKQGNRVRFDALSAWPLPNGLAALKQQEARFLAVMRDVRTYQIHGNRLELRSASKVVARFTGTYQAPPEPRLSDTVWGLAELNGTRVAIPKTNARTIQMESTRHILFVFDGVRHTTGGWRDRSGVLTFSLYSEKEEVPADASPQGQDFYDALKRTKTYRHQGKNLELRDEKGVVLARFRALASR